MSHVESLDAAKSKGPEIFFLLILIYSHELTKQLPIPYQKSGSSGDPTTCRVSLSLYST